MNEQLDLASYADLDYSDTFGNQADATELLKAIQAGSITGRDTANQSLTQEPLKLESLEHTLKSLEFRMKDVKLWNAIPKDIAANTVEEYVTLESYGADVGGFYDEGQLADSQDSKYNRHAELVKYIQVVGSVTLQAQLVKSFVPAMAREVENKTMWVIRKLSSSLTKANSDIISQEFNGIFRQHARIGSTGQDQTYATLDAYQDSPAVIDLRGDSLSQQDLDTAGVNINQAFGDIDSLWAPPMVLSGLFSDFFQRQRLITGDTSNKGIIGTVPKGIDTQFGTIMLNQDKFMQQSPARLLTDAATAPKAPAAPAVSSQALVADTTTRFVAGEVFSGALGTVFYAVSAVNQYGESALTVFSNTVKITTTAGDAVDLTFSAGAGGSFAPSGYRIYRSMVTAATNATTGNVKFYPIFKVSTSQLAAGYDGGAAGVARDKNRFLPGTEQGFVTEMVEEVLKFKQLAPLSKLDLAITGPSNQFLSFLYGTPQYTGGYKSAGLTGAQKMVRYINIGPYIPGTTH